MRAPRNEATGTSGETEVLAQFERLGWAGVVDSRHDTGTDLFLRPRDRRRFELGVLIGAQVKTGPSWFESPHRDGDGAVDGWWFSDGDREHVDYWTTHTLPQILVLRDQNVGESYWVHVTNEAVVPTGRGSKVLVPRNQTVDEDHRDALTAVAMTQIPPVAWEGSAWSGAVVLPRDRIRNAMIAPRLIVPHPNATPVSIDGVQALAALVLLRPEVDRVLDEGAWAQEIRNAGSGGWTGPTLTEALGSSDWAWRAVAALRCWIYDGDQGPSESLSSLASVAEERVASAVIRADILLHEGRLDDALEIIDEALSSDDAQPADHAWLQAQKTWVLSEIGRVEEAVDLGFAVLRARRLAPADVTLAAIAGAATNVIFRAAGWSSWITPEGDDGQGANSEEDGSQSQRIGVGLSDVIGNNDTAASWWRSQLVSWALPEELGDIFRTWAKDTSIRIGGGDQVYRLVRSASLLSAFAADGEGWRSALRMLAQHLLARTDRAVEPGEAKTLLNMLRQSGASDDVKLATRRIVRQGPAIAGREAARDVNPALSTHSSALADLDLLTAAGDVLDPGQATSLCVWALDVLKDPSEYFQRTHPTFYVQFKLIDFLSAAVGAAEEGAQHEVINYILNQDATGDGIVDLNTARLIRSIPESAWTSGQLEHAAILAHHESSRVTAELQRLTSRSDTEIRERLVNRAKDGDVAALEGVKDVTTLPAQAAGAVIAKLREQVETLCEDARRGAFSGGGIEPVRELTLLNLWHPSVSSWEPVLAALQEPSVHASQQAGALDLIARLGERVPNETRERLIEVIRPLLVKQPIERWIDQTEVRGLAREALYGLGERLELQTALLGGPDERRSAAYIIGRTEQTDQLDVVILLANDHELEVRAAAANVLSRWTSKGLGGEKIAQLAMQLIAHSGTDTAAALAAPLAETANRPATAEDLAMLLAGHPSASVRRMVTPAPPNQC